MSGTNLVEHAQNGAAPHATSTSSEDYAASLRAAALMTLKAKRRKPATSQAEPILPHRAFAPADTIELDYGQEEPIAASSIASSPPVAPAKLPTPLSTSTGPMDVDHVQAREEGEISDSEMAPPTPKTKLEPMSPVLDKPPTPTSLNRLEPVIQPMTLAPDVAPEATSVLPHESVAPSSAAMLVDEYHVRPGLAMTQAQYDTAKDIVLDLLGWGVPPEYLVNCGLSREIVYYVFVELNLRLPSNLDTTGLPSIATSASRSSANVPSSDPTRSNQSSNPQPPMDVTPHVLSAMAPPFVPATPESNTPVAGPSSATLHDMEQQRKQELLARKAVLASRKSKQKATESVSTTTPHPHTVKPTPSVTRQASKSSVPTEIVDDFLQSIDPVASTESSARPKGTHGFASLHTPRSIYDMDIDDVPGLTTLQEPVTEYTPLPRPRLPAVTSDPPLNKPSFPAEPQSAISTASDRSAEASARLSSFRSTPSSYDNDEDMDAVPGLYRSRSPREDSKLPPPPRRGTKRPVAADFVDMEPGPSRPPAKGPPDLFRANIRRKTTGFAGLTQRRCVIDLSDSEDESTTAKPNGLPPRTDSRASNVPTPQATAAPTPRHASPAMGTAITPNILQEKEEQIRRMRELIAQREQSRKKKLAESSQSTPTTSGTPNNGVAFVKQEDDESLGVRSFLTSRSTSSTTPDPTTTKGRLQDSPDEQSVLNALLPHESGQSSSVSLPESESSSGAATPIDGTPMMLEHTTTGDKVLTDEARHEQVVLEAQDNPEPSQDVAVDVIGFHPETSAQVTSDNPGCNPAEQATEETSAFASYHSLLDRHPRLRDHSRQNAASKSFFTDSGSLSSPGAMLQSSVDLEPLKQTAVMNYLSSGSGRVCQYEVPGGGECRDQHCEDVHLSRLSSVEPSDEDTAQYLCSSIPVGQRYGVKAFRDALDVARLRHPTMTFDARVQEALTSLGLR
ncbi:hypothetical protein C8Q70DRAFT_963776 [Cubamyces menziesii]|nr:hypothetical protein C8Q70DRAFT_963776 [Cubamyces menziesii]